jgi:DNA-binding NarL/FixJ family response regulator
MPSTVLIVDDHAGFRSLARVLLETEGFEVVGDVGDGESALAAAELLRPAVVILDIQLPDIDGFEVAERLTRLPDPPVVMLVSTRDAPSVRGRVEASSARGFVPKHELSGAAITALLSP